MPRGPSRYPGARIPVLFARFSMQPDLVFYRTFSYAHYLMIYTPTCYYLISLAYGLTLTYDYDFLDRTWSSCMICSASLHMICLNNPCYVRFLILYDMIDMIRMI